MPALGTVSVAAPEFHRQITCHQAAGHRNGASGSYQEGMDSLVLRSPAGRLDQSPAYTLRLAADADEITAAQRLRWNVFTGEFGAILRSPVPGLDIDAFDEFCDHLVVVDERDGQVVATYRLLRPGRCDVRYADSEFDLRALDGLAGQLVETGRSCVHPDHRAGAAINLLWAGMARYMHLYNMRYLGGCASVDLADGGHAAASVRALAAGKHQSPEPLRVTPRRPWPGLETFQPRPTPALLKGYLRLGAWICGQPSYDPDFNCADFYVLLDVTRVDARYMRHFLGADHG
jgi:putative hemolysin